MTFPADAKTLESREKTHTDCQKHPFLDFMSFLSFS